MKTNTFKIYVEPDGTEFVYQAVCIPSMWEVLNRFDSEAAARVSGVAETVDYFG